MAGFLQRWANPFPPRPAGEGPEGAAEPTQPNAEPVPRAIVLEREEELPWAEWKAAALNRLFQQQGITGLPSRITPATIRHSEMGGGRLDSRGTNEQAMSPAEVTE